MKRQILKLLPNLFMLLVLFVFCVPLSFFTSNKENPVTASGQDKYQYPLYPWRHDYHQAIVFKLKSSTGDNPPSQVYNVQESLEQIKTLHYLSRGMPIIVYLSGWQQGGHDHQYPCLNKPGYHLMRPGIDKTPLEALRWLMETAKEYNAVVSIQINMHKAVADNELYWHYKEEGLFSSGTYEGFSNSIGVESNRINTKLEWERGYTQMRIDSLLAMLPELTEIGTIHIDNFRPFESETVGTTREEIMPYIKAIMYYFKDEYGIDVTCESTFNKRPDHDNLYGFQPWALSYTGMRDYNMRVPAYMYCGGRKYDDEVFGSGSNYMKLFYTSDSNSIKESLYTRSVPFYYLSRLIRLKYSSTTGDATLSNNVSCYDKSKFSYDLRDIRNWILRKKQLQNGYYESSTSVIECDENFVKKGTDVFIPALWRSQKEVIAYSKEGYAERRWIFPSDWADVQAIDVYEIGINGLVLLRRNEQIKDNSIVLALKPNQAFSILPSGSDPDYNPPIPKSGEIQFIGEDRKTKGTWIGVYGTKGYEIIEGNSLLPPNITLSFIGGTNTIWANPSSDLRALQKPGKSSERMIASCSSTIHEIIDVQVNDPRCMDKNSTDIAIYFIDWHNNHRQLIVDAVCANTNHALHTRILRDFSDGVYLKYTVKGHIQFRITVLGENGNKFEGGDATFSGIFFD